MRPLENPSPRGRPGAAARAFLFLAALSSGCAGPRHEIVLEGSTFRVTGLRPHDVANLSVRPGDRALLFPVYVAGAQDPLLGEYRLEGETLVFEPRFPLREGLEYRAVFITSPHDAVGRAFSVPAPPPAPPTAVRRVFPSRDVLPENQLKFYLHFSAPMARGEAYRRIHLLHSDGRAVDMPFLELGEELWDPSGMRLTLFFDPGRIKRGLKPREEFGPALEEGKSYTLVVDREWQDASGRPLREGHRKAFRVVAPDDTQPDPKRWTLQPPRAGTTDALTVLFDEPLDEGMLGRVLVVQDAAKKPVAGRIEIDREETRWRFLPETAWGAGGHFLLVDQDLEDLAGNSLGRPFEVDVVRPLERAIAARAVSLPFDVK